MLKLLIDYSLASTDEIKAIEEEETNSVQERTLTAARRDNLPPDDWMYRNLCHPELTDENAYKNACLEKRTIHN
jgi:hypothetical protein